MAGRLPHVIEYVYMGLVAALIAAIGAGAALVVMRLAGGREL